MQILALILIAWLIAAGAAEAVARSHAPRGRMVDIGGRRLRLVCEGPLSAAPTVWMEAGAFSGAADFGDFRATAAWPPKACVLPAPTTAPGWAFPDLGPKPCARTATPSRPILTP